MLQPSYCDMFIVILTTVLLSSYCGVSSLKWNFLRHAVSVSAPAPLGSKGLLFFLTTYWPSCRTF